MLVPKMHGLEDQCDTTGLLLPACTHGTLVRMELYPGMHLEDYGSHGAVSQDAPGGLWSARSWTHSE